MKNLNIYLQEKLMEKDISEQKTVPQKYMNNVNGENESTTKAALHTTMEPIEDGVSRIIALLLSIRF